MALEILISSRLSCRQVQIPEISRDRRSIRRHQEKKRESRARRRRLVEEASSSSEP
jgi:hypothetical protein